MRKSIGILEKNTIKKQKIKTSTKQRNSGLKKFKRLKTDEQRLLEKKSKKKKIRKQAKNPESIKKNNKTKIKSNKTSLTHLDQRSSMLTPKVKQKDMEPRQLLLKNIKNDKFNFKNIYDNKINSQKVIHKITDKKKHRRSVNKKKISLDASLGITRNGNKKLKIQARKKKLKTESLTTKISDTSLPGFDIYEHIVNKKKKLDTSEGNSSRSSNRSLKNKQGVHVLYESFGSNKEPDSISKKPKKRKKKISIHSKGEIQRKGDFSKKFESLIFEKPEVQGSKLKPGNTERDLNSNLPESFRRLTLGQSNDHEHLMPTVPLSPSNRKKRLSIEMDSISNRYISQTDCGLNLPNNLAEIPKMLKYEHTPNLKCPKLLEVERIVPIGEEVHLSAFCFMPDEDVFAVGGWNSKNVSFYDAKEENYFQSIMVIETQHIFNLSNLKYLEELKLLFVGDCFSGLSVYRLAN